MYVQQFPQFDGFSCSGEWWVPGSNDSPLVGTLSCNEGELTLELNGFLWDIGSDEKSKSYTSVGGIKFSCLYGRVNDQAVTLFTVSEKLSRINFGAEKQKISYSCRFMIAGDHLESFETLTYRQAKVCLANIDEWVPGPLFVSGKPYKRAFTIDYEGRPVHLNVTMTYRKQRSGHGRWFGYISICPMEVRSLEWYEMILFKIRSLLSFLLAKTIMPSHFWMSGDNPRIKYQYVNPMCIRLETVNSSRHGLFLYQQIEPLFDTILKKWLDEFENYKYIWAFYLGFYNGYYKWEEHKFFSFTASAEGIHRLMYGETKDLISDIQFENAKNLIINAIPAQITRNIPSALNKQIKDKLIASISTANCYSLADRLKDLFYRIPDEYRYTLLRLKDDQEIDELIHLITDNRNFMGHQDPKRKEIFEGPVQYYLTSWRLWVLLTYHLSLMLGIDTEIVCAAIQKSRHFDLFGRAIVTIA